MSLQLQLNSNAFIQLSAIYPNPMHHRTRYCMLSSILLELTYRTFISPASTFLLWQFFPQLSGSVRSPTGKLINPSDTERGKAITAMIAQLCDKITPCFDVASALPFSSLLSSDSPRVPIFCRKCPRNGIEDGQVPVASPCRRAACPFNCSPQHPFPAANPRFSYFRRAHRRLLSTSTQG